MDLCMKLLSAIFRKQRK